MNITLAPNVAIDLETITTQVRGQEFSGFGFVEQRPDGLYVYDYVILDVGSQGYTEIQPEDVMALASRPDAANMRLWMH